MGQLVHIEVNTVVAPFALAVQRYHERQQRRVFQCVVPESGTGQPTLPDLGYRSTPQPINTEKLVMFRPTQKKSVRNGTDNADRS